MKREVKVHNGVNKYSVKRSKYERVINALLNRVEAEISLVDRYVRMDSLA